MNKGIIVHLDNEKKEVLEKSKNLFDQHKLGLEYVCCSSVEEFDAILNKRGGEIKAFVFDLIGEQGTTEELKHHTSEFAKQITSQFEKFRVPIFIYSGYLDNYDEFEYVGTVFKIDKDQGFGSVVDKIKLFAESGFLEVFCTNGVIDTLFSADLHDAFTQQFNSSDDIENIIKNINLGSKLDVRRTQEVFTRIAVRSLMSKLLAPDLEDPKSSFLNGVEHYHKRLSDFEFWTGDILKNKKSDQCLLIITPRCNVASKGYNELLVCEVILGDFPKKLNTEGKEKIKHALTDKPEVSGYNRYIPPSPVFAGGKVVLSRYQMIKKDLLQEQFDVVISLSDELTNEMLGKFGSYFFRTGISPWDSDEVIDHIAAVS